MKRRLVSLVWLAALAAPLPALAQDRVDVEELGTVSFPVACDAPAQQLIHRAVAMLHSFWFPESLRAFEAAAAADPGCGIAHWGAALSHFGNPMGVAAARRVRPPGGGPRSWRCG